MYKPLANALANMHKAGKDVDAPVVQGGKMEPGNTYDAKIMGVAINNLEKYGYIELQLEAQSGHYLDSRVWPVGDDGRVGKVFTHVLNAMFARTDSLDMIGAVFGEVGDDVFNLMRGMKIRVTIGAGEGYRTYLLPTGKYVLVAAGRDPDQASSRVIPDEFASIAAADSAARTKGLRPSFAKVFKYEPISEQQAADNWNLFGQSHAALIDALKRAGTGQAPEQAAEAPISGT